MDVIGLVVKEGLRAAMRKLDEALKVDIEKARDQALLDMLQVAYAMTKALAAVGMRRDPTDAEVEAFLAEAVGDPRFPARAHRLVLEAFGSPSSERRRRLAAVLLGGPKVVPKATDLERVDALVARLLDEDVALLAGIVGLATRLRQSSNEAPSFVVSTDNGGEVRYRLPLPATPGRESMTVTEASVLTLLSMGCLASAGRTSSVSSHLVEVTSLGVSLVDVLKREPIRSGLADDQDDVPDDDPDR